MRNTNKIFITLLILFITNYLNAQEENILSDINKDKYFQKIIYRSYRTGAIDEQGISIHNKKSEKGFNIEFQHICWDAIVAGIGKENQHDIELGIKAIEYGFSKMNPDGSFPNYSTAGISQFLLAFAKSYYEINNSFYKDIYIDDLNKYVPKLKKAIYYFFHSPEWESDKKEIYSYTNQVLAAGLIFKLNGTIINDKNLINYGDNLFTQGIIMQKENGIFEEKGGYDSSYQAVSLMFLSIYYLYVADENEKAKLFLILQKGWNWQFTRIKPSGEIDATGNTRTGLKQEKWRGKYKDINVPEVCLSLIYWAYISNNTEIIEKAKKVYEYALE